MARRFRRRGPAKLTAKSIEANLKRNIQDLVDDPSLMIPECTDSSGQCKHLPVRPKLEKLAAKRRGGGKLEFAARWARHPLVRGFAAATLLLDVERIKYTAKFPSPFGEATYIRSGKAMPAVLAGLMNFPDPGFRMLAYVDHVRKTRVHIYSGEEGLTCTGKEPAAPEWFVKEMEADLPYRLGSGSERDCGHPAATPALHIRWESAGRGYRICKSCAKQDSNALSSLRRNILARDSLDDFSIMVDWGWECAIKGEACTIEPKDTPRDSLSDYAEGRVGDSGFIDGEAERIAEHVTRSKRQVFVLGGTCYEGDRQAFLKALQGDQFSGLPQLLEHTHSSFFSFRNDANEVLTHYWPEGGLDYLMTVADPATAKEAFANNDSPALALAQARRASEGDKLARELGIDDQAKTELVLLRDCRMDLDLEGPLAVARRLKGNEGKTAARKALTLAILHATGQGGGAEWAFQKEEKDLAEHLAPLVEEALKGDASGFRERCEGLLGQAGL